MSKMITESEAKKIALAHITDLEAGSPDFPKLTLTSFKDYEFGWVFCYQSEVYLQTGNVSYALAGNAPVIIDQTDGSTHTTGTTMPIEYYIEEYTRGRDNR